MRSNLVLHSRSLAGWLSFPPPMSEKPLQSSAASGVYEYRVEPYVRWGAIVVGVFAVLVGLADITSRIAENYLGEDALQQIFAPAGTLPLLPSESVNTAQAAAPFAPARLTIPSIGVDARVEQVGKKAGSMATPKDYNDVAWYEYGGRPGGPGNAVFAGHVNNALTTAGVFMHLEKLSIGDYVTVADTEGKTLVYKVKAIDQYKVDEAPAASIFAATGPSQLILITCDGEWVQSERTFDKRLVITAVPAYR
jgi:sortase A